MKLYTFIFVVCLRSVHGLGLSYEEFLRRPQKIIGGVDASEGRYPYFTSLLYKPCYFEYEYEFFDCSGGLFRGCGGALIAPNIVLTAAHCYFEVAGNNEPSTVRISDYNDDSGSTEEFSVKEHVLHPGYDDETAENDVMVLVLNGESSFQPINIDDGSVQLSNNTELTVIGFGNTNNSDFYYFVEPTVLQEVQLLFVPDSECEKVYNGSGPIDLAFVSDNMLCASSPGKDSCQGDSGGPLFVKGATPEDDVQVGIVSWGFGCAEPGFPGVYAKVSTAFDFVTQVVEENKIKDDSFKLYVPFVAILGLLCVLAIVVCISTSASNRAPAENETKLAATA